jgi:hypothetical protein
MNEFPFTLVDPVCGKPALRMRAIPKPTDTVAGMVERCQHIDGRPAKPSDPFVCDSCGRTFYMLDLRLFTDPSNFIATDQ